MVVKWFLRVIWYFCNTYDITANSLSLRVRSFVYFSWIDKALCFMIVPTDELEPETKIPSCSIFNSNRLLVCSMLLPFIFFKKKNKREEKENHTYHLSFTFFFILQLKMFKRLINLIYQFTHYILLSWPTQAFYCLKTSLPRKCLDVLGSY